MFQPIGQELHDLCNKAVEIGLDIDPNGIYEDRDEILSQKLTDRSTTLRKPSLLKGSLDIQCIRSATLHVHGHIKLFAQTQPFVCNMDFTIKFVFLVSYV